MISIIIATYNRKALIEECLESILSQDFAGDFEVIVIDNGASDGTGEFLMGIINNKVKFIINKTRLNLSICKNLGLRASSGDIIAFTDDDCRVGKGWLKTIESSLINCDIVAGPVLPLPGTKFPRWWSYPLNWLIGVNLKPSLRLLPLGSNIAFKKYVLLKVREGKARIFPSDNLHLPYTEDNCRLKRALACGFSMSLNENMVVYHYIPAKRLKIAYLIKRSYNDGVAWLGYEENPGNLLFSLAALPYNFVRLVIFFDISRFFFMISNLSYILNYIVKSLIRWTGKTGKQIPI